MVWPVWLLQVGERVDPDEIRGRIDELVEQEFMAAAIDDEHPVTGFADSGDIGEDVQIAAPPDLHLLGPDGIVGRAHLGRQQVEVVIADLFG